jgi:serine/threonine-protein kinase SRPK3
MVNPNPCANKQQDVPHFTFSEEASGPRHRKVFVTFRVAQDSHLALVVASNFKLNWDLVQRQVSGLHETTCKFLTQFVYPGIDDDKEYLCLVTELFSSSVQDTLEALQGEFIPVPSVKRILRHVLLGIVRLHKCGIVHTGLMQCKHARRYSAGQYHD